MDLVILCTVSVLILTILLIGFLGLIFVIDCDLLLLWKSKFGAKTDSLAGKVVWITGASSGIGEFLAYKLAESGCQLVLSARRVNELQRVKSECILRGRVKEDDVLVLEIDVLDFNKHTKAANKILSHFGKIDILVNNAGRSQRALAAETSIEVDREMIEMNTLSVLSLTKAVLPHMMERKEGHIVVTSSVAGKIGAPFSATYSATKFALQGWFDALRIEQKENNINVTMVCPGPVFSNLLQHAFTGEAGTTYNRDMQATEKRITTERCAELMAIAMANNMYEVWISFSPPLFFTYLTQYSPTLARWIAGIVGMKAIHKIREGNA